MRRSALLTAIMFFSLFRTQAQPLEVGVPAPTLSAIDQEGNPLAFADVYAKGTTLVYFYPKADTPGCTAQACSLRDSFASLQQDGLQIIGVSKDKPEAQKKFQSKYNLPFPLIADTDGKVAEAFGVPVTLGFPSRQSFLVKEGKIVWISPKAGTGNHAAEVRMALDELN